MHGMVDGCLTGGIWNPGRHGVTRNAGSGGGTKTTLDVDASWPAADVAVDDADDDADDDDAGAFISTAVNDALLLSYDSRSIHSVGRISASALAPLHKQTKSATFSKHRKHRLIHTLVTFSFLFS